MENRSFRGIQIFRLVIIQNSAAEGDGATATIPNRKNNPFTKAVVVLTFFFTVFTFVFLVTLNYQSGP